MSEAVVVAENLSKKYVLYSHPTDRLKELLLHRSVHEEFWALRNITLQVARGEAFGIIGQNGSGKSTLLQLLAGVLQPTSGQVVVKGRVSTLLELGAGFNPEFTGRENVVLNGAILGVSETEMRRRLPAIAEFAEMGGFLDKPVKTYSNGMYVRLAFATAINIDPDVLLIDEALAVGDAYFQHRCMLRMSELQDRGVTIIVVSHDVAAIKRLCHRVMWLQHGQVADEGSPERVVARYLASLFGHAERQDLSEQPGSPIVVPSGPAQAAPANLSAPHVDRRFGDGAAEITGIGLANLAGAQITSEVHGLPFVIRVRVVFHQAVSRPMIGFVLRDRLGTDLASTNTTLEGYVLPGAQAGDSFVVDFICHPPHLHPGHYAICAAVAGGDTNDYVMHDWIDNATTIEIIGDVPIHTVMRFPVECKLEVSRGLDGLRNQNAAPTKDFRPPELHRTETPLAQHPDGVRPDSELNTTRGNQC